MNAEEELKIAKEEIEKLKKTISIDLKAREGQVKRTRMLEHQLHETEEELKKRQRECILSKKKIEAFESALNAERSRRLNDLHKAYRTTGNVTQALQREREMEQRYFSTQATLDDTKNLCQTLETALDAHQQLTTKAVVDIGIQDTDIERLQAEILALKSTLLEKCDLNHSLEKKIYSQHSQIKKLQSNLTRLEKQSSRKIVHATPTNQVTFQVARSNKIQHRVLSSDHNCRTEDNRNIHTSSSSAIKKKDNLLLKSANLSEFRAHLASRHYSQYTTSPAATFT
uniref:Uncharacterized protein n=1 Tax=Aureoumbra lagunensis TaxID=44058 RepID=A0A7S3NDK5_9STRA